MHNAAFRVLELDWTYELLDVSPRELPSAVKRLREADVAGANVTIPHKQAVMQHMDAVDPEAVKARAVTQSSVTAIGWLDQTRTSPPYAPSSRASASNRLTPTWSSSAPVDRLARLRSRWRARTSPSCPGTRKTLTFQAG
ncbi:MAG: hypothetical protein M3R21_07755 [Candidatus Dormibacteraeota bacterium]|nr:hypothetical protein [Candidatus Dormibacteraeota bacterium]